VHKTFPVSTYPIILLRSKSKKNLSLLPAAVFEKKFEPTPIAGRFVSGKVVTSSFLVDPVFQSAGFKGHVTFHEEKDCVFLEVIALLQESCPFSNSIWKKKKVYTSFVEAL